MMEIPVIYEDSNIVAVNKPAGIVVHRSATESEEKKKYLTDWLVEKYPTIKNVGDEPELRPGIVHRLDKETSGVLIIAKNQKAFEFLKKQFKEKAVVKKYIALLRGVLKEDNGVIDLPIGKSKVDFRKRAIGKAARGELKEAHTEYRVLERFSDYTLVEAFIKTGRTHQIRVHFAAISKPLACDHLYGAGKGKVCPQGLDRIFLHANYLEISLPNDSKIKLEADLPEDLAGALDLLRKK
ncbi:TPA: RluA family pseudouridine synthase [Patescibacteria group bacterium]|nr:MAG: Pseudouridine synthase, RluA family [Parcubacteria group bacterium GW2011_GWF2_40_10]KKR46862.1 MAG: Pseudouridine synthase, RluA family [Parcubacteria group bacterium GW2011_GWA2_40_143]KKR60303.1 MAG: Pseudouridine synthase, RluA family [Parcubacteria group bacterium GW2011_GWC2_40_31]KKR75344.1 MAG: Pseudouridine synthase, RluA family [Parcubacteria group bacterium GW2011_GWB2_40_8]KKR75739.1 MAG: Pseudouridine synthase, RluA family [Parcubacteria group bacterium GW2011_GWE2_40_8]HB